MDRRSPEFDTGLDAEGAEDLPEVVVDPVGRDEQQGGGRGHSLTIDSGWREVAQTALDFIQRFVK